MFNKSYQSLIDTKRLSDNEDFYNNVFKKTERIISAIQYVLSFMTITNQSKSHISALDEASTTLHQTVLDSLSWLANDIPKKIYQLQHTLVVLDSKLRVAIAGRVITEAVASTILSEIDLVLRYLNNHYSHSAVALPVNSSAPNHQTDQRLPVTRRPRPIIPKNDLSSEAVLVYSQLSDRATRIKTVLKAKPEATIKDITDIITDVSAKTIQRDLNVMIEEGTVIRQGERRWSKYSVTN